jgi:CRP/FNR family transcriptional regulator, nitrogen oxide reductase regulator
MSLPSVGSAAPVRALKPAGMSWRAFLERIPLFAGVAPAVVEHLADVATAHDYERGEHLWRAGDAPLALMIVRSGLVKLTRPAPHGRTAICGLFGVANALGELALIKGIPFPTSTVAATNKVTVVSIPRADALEALRNNATLSLNLLSTLETRLSLLHDKIDVLSAGSVEARLATLLLKLYEQFGDDFDDRTSRIPVPLSRQELADLVSTSFETAIRVVSRWERAGVVSTDSDGFTLHDLAQLRRVSGVAGADTPPPALHVAR